MISQATGQPLRSRLSPAELKEHEIRKGVEQGPVPACLRAGYQPSVAVVRTLPSCASPAPPQAAEKATPFSQRKLVPQTETKPLADPEARRQAVAAQIKNGAWRTAWEIARSTDLHPEVVRATLHSLRAVSRPVPEADTKTRGGWVEYATAGTPGAATESRRRPTRWTHVFCEVCERPEEFDEVPSDGGIDLVCSECRSVVATLYRGMPTRERTDNGRGRGV